MATAPQLNRTRPCRHLGMIPYLNTSIATSIHALPIPLIRLRHPVSLCLTLSNSRCYDAPVMPHATAATHESMNVAPSDLEESTPFIRRRPVRLIIYTGLVLFVLIMVIWPLIAQLKDPDHQKHIAEHRVMVGMSKEQVLEAWGGPQTINTTFTKEGIRREEWIFEDWENAAVVKHRYLYFEEGNLIGGWFQGSGERLPTQSPSNPHSPKPRN